MKEPHNGISERDKKHIKFLVLFTIVYIAIKYGYPLLKQAIF